MARRKKGLSKAEYEKLLKNGQGEKENYRPLIHAKDGSGEKNWTIRADGIKIHRQHHFLSKLEETYFYLLEFCDFVVDIREQFALLPVAQTKLIAQQFGITYPKNPNTQEDAILSTDFLITTKVNNKVGHFARTVKLPKELDDKRVLDKFEIERRFWQKKRVDWGIVGDLDKYQVLADNIAHVREFINLDNKVCFQGMALKDITELVRLFKTQISGTTVINEAKSLFEQQYGLKEGCGLSIYKHLIITKQIKVDLVTRPLNYDIPQFVKVRN